MPHDVDDSILNCLLSIQSVHDRAYVPIVGIKEFRLGRAFNLPQASRLDAIVSSGEPIPPIQRKQMARGCKHRPHPQTHATVASTLYAVRSIETSPRKCFRPTVASVTPLFVCKQFFPNANRSRPLCAATLIAWPDDPSQPCEAPCFWPCNNRNIPRSPTWCLSCIRSQPCGPITRTRRSLWANQASPEPS